MFYFFRKSFLGKIGYTYHSYTKLWESCGIYVHDDVIRNIPYKALKRELWECYSEFHLVHDADIFAVVYGGKFNSHDILKTLVYQTIYPSKKLSEYMLWAFKA